MLKVNEEKLLHDYHVLDAKKADNLAVIEKDAKAYAEAHGYNEAQTAELMACVTKLQNGGLTADESAKLAILGEYIDDVAEKVVTETETASEAQAATTPNTANSTVNVI